MCYAKMYQNSGSDSLTKTYSTPIDVSDAHDEVWTDSTDHMNDKWYWITTDSNTWVWLFTKTKYGGDDNIVVGPNTSTYMARIGMADTQIESFKVCDHNPHPAEGNLPATYVKFWQGDNYDKLSQEFKTVQNQPNVPKLIWAGDKNDNMENDISCVETGPSTWLSISTELNYGGRTTIIGPNQRLKLRGVLVDDWNMDNTIKSFQVYDHAPTIPASMIVSNYRDAYTDVLTSTQSTDVADLTRQVFYAQNSAYRVQDPMIELTKSQNGQIDVAKFTLVSSHPESNADDIATVTFSLDYQGRFVDGITIDYKMSGTDDMPQWAIDLLENYVIPDAKKTALAIADAFTEAVSEGEATGDLSDLNKILEGASKALCFCLDNLNKVLKMFNKMEDNGGEMYFSSVVAHTIPRLVNAYYQTLYGINSTAANYFSPAGKGIGYSSTAFVSDLTDGQTSAYNTTDRDSPFVEFTSNTYPYRCYEPDTTTLYSYCGSLRTAKITAIMDNKQDNYLDLQAVFDYKGTLICVKGTADMYSSSADNAPSTCVLVLKGGVVYKCVEDDDPIPTVYLDLYTAFLGEMKTALTGYEGQKLFMADAATDVLRALNAAYVPM